MHLQTDPFHCFLCHGKEGRRLELGNKCLHDDSRLVRPTPIDGGFGNSALRGNGFDAHCTKAHFQDEIQCGCQQGLVLFNNAGVASSSGEVPTSFAEMAASAAGLIDALGLATVDVLGFSIGSMIAQNVAMQRPDQVRKLTLVGSGPRNGDGIPLTPESQVIFTNSYGNLDDFWIDGFFTASPESQAAGHFSCVEISA